MSTGVQSSVKMMNHYWKHSYKVEVLIFWLRFGINDWFLVFLACRIRAYSFIQVVPLRISWDTGDNFEEKSHQTKQLEFV